jgi:hypothetical protein
LTASHCFNDIEKLFVLRPSPLKKKTPLVAEEGFHHVSSLKLLVDDQSLDLNIRTISEAVHVDACGKGFGVEANLVG